MDKKNEVLEALADWILNVTAKKGLATPEEVTALPKVAEIVLNNYSSELSFSPVNNE